MDFNLPVYAYRTCSSGYLIDGRSAERFRQLAIHVEHLVQVISDCIFLCKERRELDHSHLDLILQLMMGLDVLDHVLAATINSLLYLLSICLLQVLRLSILCILLHPCVFLSNPRFTLV